MMTGLLLLRGLLGLCLLAYLAYAGMAVWAARRWHLVRTSPNPAWTPAVTILKPVRGIDAHAYANFASFCHLDYPTNRFQILFGVLDPTDPVIGVVRQLQQEFPDRDIDLVIGGPEAVRGLNFKVCNLAAMLPVAKHDLLVLCDSDMRVFPDYLRRIVAPFESRSSQRKEVGLVTCPYRGAEPQSLAAALEALGIGADFVPSALVSRMLEGVGFAFGSTIVLPRAVLEALGGFEALFHELADDFRLGHGTRRLGYEVVLSDYVVDDVLGAERFGPMWSRRLRWARTVRACRPGGYAGSFVTYGTALGLLFLLVMGLSPLGWAGFATVLAWRLLTTLWITTAYTGDPNIRRFLPLLPLSDLLSFALFLASYGGNTIEWRGERLRLGAGGVLLNRETREIHEKGLTL